MWVLILLLRIIVLKVGFVMIERVYKIVMFGNEGVGKIGKEVFVIYFLFV